MLLLDLMLPGGDGLMLLGGVKALYPNMPVVMMTAFATVSTAVEAMRRGAGNYLAKPFGVNDLRKVLEETKRTLNFDMEKAVPSASACEPRTVWAI